MDGENTFTTKKRAKNTATEQCPAEELGKLTAMADGTPITNSAKKTDITGKTKVLGEIKNGKLSKM